MDTLSVPTAASDNYTLQVLTMLYICTSTAGVDFTSNSQILTFGPGSAPPTSMTFEVTLTDEQLVEADEEFGVMCQVISGAAQFDNGQASDTAAVSILNDDCKL